MKKLSILPLMLLLLLAFASCGQDETKTETEAPEVTYVNISAEEAKQIMDSQKDFVILDVRTEQEYNEGHIPEAILIPDTEITEKAEKVLKDKNQLILVYCRSGRRSKIASKALADLGYTNVKEFGGIIDWEYETETN